MAFSKRVTLFQGPVMERGGWRDVSPPDGWTWSLPLTIQTDGSSFQVSEDFDLGDFAPSGKAYYVSPTGSNGNTGLDWDHAYATIAYALGRPDVVMIYVAPGTYQRIGTAFPIGNITKNVSIIGVGGIARVVTSQGDLVWSLTADQTYTYQTTRSNAWQVLDGSNQDAEGDYQVLAARASIAEVEANSGSYWISGDTVYVHPFDDRAPDTDIWVCLSVGHTYAQGDYHVYVENIEFIGGSRGVEFDNTGAGQTPEFYAKSCKFLNAQGNGLELTGVEQAILQDCLAAHNRDDGFNHHALNGVVPKVIEINCTSRDNGASGNTDNGSSVHDGGSIVRIHGEYSNNVGPNVHDISTDTQSWNLGVYAHDSASGVNDLNFAIGWSTGAGGTLWLDRCRSGGSATDLYIEPGAAAYIRGFSSGGNYTGTPGSY